MLARKIARSQTFFHGIDALSGIMTVWTLANIIVVAICVPTRSSPPVSISHILLAEPLLYQPLTQTQYRFLLSHGVITILIWLAQLSSFLWIVWSTHALLAVKIRWSISIGLFMPCVHSNLQSRGDPHTNTRTRRACLAAVITRLLILPPNLFASDDWTFTSIPTALVFIAEVLLSVMNLLAPSLPVFFDQTSTGGLHFVPGNTPRTTQFSSSGPSQKLGSVDERQIPRAQQQTKSKSAMQQGSSGRMGFPNADNLCSTSIRCDEELRETSFDSDTILVRRSVEIR